ncbi:MAG: hypothetical protein AMS20_11465 [Gemmatimonas sp. SG8_28]|nr:MAG: hypothetical protein AMS20_11465 [Gemmatimonas sp. SG8_28]
MRHLFEFEACMRMVTRVMFPLVALTLAIPSVGSGQQFEGVLTMREVRFEIDAVLARVGGSAEELLPQPLERLRETAEDAGAGLEELSLTYYLKGNKLRTSNDGSSGEDAGYMLLDFGTGLYQLVDPAQKLIVEWVADSVADGAIAEEEAATDLEIDIQPLDETRTINGFTCAGFRVVHEGGIVEITWLTDALQDLTGSFAQLADLSARFAEEGSTTRPLDRFLELGFPILTMTVDTDLGEFSAAEVLKAERRPLEDDLFTVPSGYLKVAMPRGGQR